MDFKFELGDVVKHTSSLRYDLERQTIIARMAVEQIGVTIPFASYSLRSTRGILHFVSELELIKIEDITDK